MRGEGCEKSNEKQEKTSQNNDKNRLNHLKCYHGVQRKEEVAMLMKDAAVGMFLVRSCFVKSEVALGLILSVKVSKGESDTSIHHYVIDYKGNEYVLIQTFSDGGKSVTVESKPFGSLEEMIEHYQHHRLACKMRLFKPLKRPSWQLRHSQVRFDESGKLGSGNFCIVYKGKLHKKDGEVKDVAIKVSKDTERDSAVLMETRNSIFAEARIMMNYRHTNVIMLYGLACDLPPFMVCMEFCAGGCLESALKKYGKEMEEFERQILLIDAARGMRYLHAQKCVHRDLASRNCLISSEGLVKIADFGLSKTLKKDEKTFKEALKEAPLAWMAPECIQRESEFSSKTDVWAFGVVIFEVYTNAEKLFAGEEDTAIVKKIRRANMPSLESKTKLPAMQAVLSAIWVRKPDDRPEFQKILEMLIEALTPIQPSDLKRMQINNLKGVARTQLPDTHTELDEVMTEDRMEAEISDKNKKAQAEKKRNTANRKRTSKKRREEQPKSRKPRTTAAAPPSSANIRKAALSE
ncbi:unnamed protein product [Caenorhabditis sp. 36 PRJEB53466]|nr:unnamed protein product [Caenorhabditis sp. 36 PRJEB53466]